MRNLFRASILLTFFAFIQTTGCSPAPVNPIGQWFREAHEPAMNLSGTEIIEFNTDSSMTVTNKMKFVHSDSLIVCELPVVITVKGVWSQTDRRDLLLTYNSATVSLMSDKKDFILKTANTKELPSEIITKTYNDICSEISEYYKNGYGVITQAGGILLSAPRVTDTELFAIINNTPVQWTRNATHESEVDKVIF